MEEALKDCKAFLAQWWPKKSILRSIICAIDRYVSPKYVIIRVCFHYQKRFRINKDKNLSLKQQSNIIAQCTERNPNFG